MVSSKEGAMRRCSAILVICLMFMLGCATVRVQAPKEPIKVDISMRLDVYQHIQNDIDAIESLVSGPGDQSFLGFFVGTAYAQGLSPAVEEAALRRKARLPALTSLESSGVVGENAAGLVVVRSGGDPSAGAIVSDENNDRMVIYGEIAAKNGTPVSDVQKLYAERLQRDAPAGTPIETPPGNWRTK